MNDFTGLYVFVFIYLPWAIAWGIGITWFTKGPQALCYSLWWLLSVC